MTSPATDPRAARSREGELLRQAREERLRIAPDLHDVMAHNISVVINVRASTTAGPPVPGRET